MRKLLILLIVCLFLVSVFAVAVLAEDDNHEDEHEYEDEDEKDDHEYERKYDEEEDEHEEDEREHEDEGSWDFSDDFDDNWVSTPPLPPSNPSTGSITKAEVAAHSFKSDCWVIIQNNAYDVTSLIGPHPGGDVFDCGADNTAIYQSQHGSSVSRMVPYLIGTIGQSAQTSTLSSNTLTNPTTSQQTTVVQNQPQEETKEVIQVAAAPEDLALVTGILAENEELALKLEVERASKEAQEQRIAKLEAQLQALQAANDVDLSPFQDDDNDGVMNSQDRFPGQDDLMMDDSDGDGVPDSEDVFPGEDDALFEDVDHDGVRDAEDSDITKDTDKDNDGIDDAYDNSDDRTILMKLLAWIGVQG